MEIIIIHVSVLIKIRTILLESLSLVLLVSHKVENTTTMVVNTFRSTGAIFDLYRHMRLNPCLRHRISPFPGRDRR